MRVCSQSTNIERSNFLYLPELSKMYIDIQENCIDVRVVTSGRFNAIIVTPKLTGQ